MVLYLSKVNTDKHNLFHRGIPYAESLVSISQPITDHCICKLSLLQLFIESHQCTQPFWVHQTWKTRAPNEEIWITEYSRLGDRQIKWIFFFLVGSWRRKWKSAQPSSWGKWTELTHLINGEPRKPGGKAYIPVLQVRLPLQYHNIILL